MPLTERQKNLLFEVYEVSYFANTVVSTGGGMSEPSPIFGIQESVKERVVNAITFIDTDEAKVSRVGEILEEFENVHLDDSTIDREGYSLRPSKNRKRVQKALYAYTGIWWNNGGSNNMRVG